MDRPARLGHVSRDRVLGEGSALARQLARAREEQQQQLQQAVQQRDNTDQSTDIREDNQEEPQLTWSELWDARTTCGYVGTALRTDESKQLQMHLWWPAEKTKRTSNVPDARFLQYSNVLARALHRQQQQGVPELGTSSAAYRRVTDLLFGPHSAPTKRRLQQQGHVAAAVADQGCYWVCCNRPLPAGTQDSDPPLGLPVCGSVNPGGAVRCVACGAAQWGGPGGQLQARLRAALQTADLDTTSLKQVVRRIAAESSSSSGVGLQLPAAAVKAELAAFLAERDSSKAAAERCKVTAVHGKAVPCAAAQAGPASSDEVQVLPPGCPVAANSVYTSLVLSLQSMPHQRRRPDHHCQQQQQQQQGDVEPSARVQAAAVAAALLAPGLMQGVFRRQNQLPEVRPVPGAVQAWLGDTFDNAAAAEMAVAGLSKVQVQAVSRPLPDHTVQQLLDRRSAVLCQELLDTARGWPAAAASGVSGAAAGGLPVVSRSYEDAGTGDVLMTEQVAPREWLAHSWSSNRTTKCSNKCSSADADVTVTEIIESDHWDAVVAVRQHVHHVLETWCGGSSTSQQQQQQQQPQASTGPRGVRNKSWQLKFQERGLRQRAHVLHAWGAAPIFWLREVLSSVCEPHHKRKLQRQAGRSKPRGHGTAAATSPPPHQQQQEGRKDKIEVRAPKGPSAAARARHRKSSRHEGESREASASSIQVQQQQMEQQEQPVKQQGKRRREQEPAPQQGDVAAGASHIVQSAKRLARAAGNSSRGGAVMAAASARPPVRQAADSTRSSSSSSSSDSDSSSSNSAHEYENSDEELSHHSAASSSGSDSEWVDNDARERMARARQARRVALADHTAQRSGTMDHESVFDMVLASIDDLMLPPQGIPHCQAFRPRPGGAWQVVTTHQGQQKGSRCQHGCSLYLELNGNNLTAGMRVVLQQAAAMGISSSVLQRTIARLEALVTQHEAANIL